MGFTTPSYDLNDLFGRVDRGDIQLPDFQRDYNWDIDRIRALIVTVLRAYPVGSFMALDTRNEPMRFRPRPLRGAPDNSVNPGLLLLDGQQRLTTLYQCLRGQGFVDTVDFRNKKICRRLFVDVDKAVSAEVMPDDAVFSADTDGFVKSHFGPRVEGSLNDPRVAMSARVLPVATLLSDRATEILFDLAASSTGDARERVKQFNTKILRPLAGYAVPMIRLDRETAQGGVGSIFAQANSAGLQMDVFELLTSVFASEDPHFSLSTSWNQVRERLHAYPQLRCITSTEFLQAVSLLVTGEKGRASGRREDIVGLHLNEYHAALPRIIQGFEDAATYLQQRRILTTELVPYTQQVVALAGILATLNQPLDSILSSKAGDRLNRWFWSGIFGELYGASAVTARASRDVAEVADWVRDPSNPEPATVRDATFTESRLLSVTSESGVYKGIYALIMGRGARDWRTAQPFDAFTYEELDADFHQIFPSQWCHDNGLSPVLADSVLNRTPMGRRTEVVRAGASPTRYLPRVQSKSLMEDKEFDTVLASHLLDPELLHASRSEEFFIDRRQRLLQMVEEAMGKQADRDVNEDDLTAGDEGPKAFDRR